MDVVFATTEKFFVGTKGCLLGNIHVVRILTISLLKQVWNQKDTYKTHIWQNRVNNHCLHDFKAHIGVPCWHVIVKSAFNILSQKLRLMLGDVSVDQSEQNTCVEELSNEEASCNECQLL